MRGSFSVVISLLLAFSLNVEANDDLKITETYKINSEFLADELQASAGFAVYNIKMVSGPLEEVGPVKIRDLSLSKSFDKAGESQVDELSDADLEEAQIVNEFDGNEGLFLLIKFKRSWLFGLPEPIAQPVEISIDLVDSRIFVPLERPLGEKAVWVASKMDPPKKTGVLSQLIMKCADILNPTHDSVDTPQEKE